MAKPFIFQITGYHNSGKTTLLNQLLRQLKKENLRAVTLKHHGHGGKPQIVEETDSARHIASGAVASLVEGGNRLLLQIEDIVWTLDEKINMLKALKPDVLFIEGHKHEDFPKLVILRAGADFHLLEELTNIAVVLYEKDKPLQFAAAPCFRRDDPEAINWVKNYIISEIKEI